MIVNDTPPRNEYNAVGIADSFAYSFGIVDATHIEVTVNGTIVSNYVVTGVGSEFGGTVLFDAPPTGVVLIYRKQPISATSRYYNNEGFPATRIETDFARQAMISQMLSEQIGRALLFDKRSLFNVSSMTDPDATGKFLYVVSLDPLILGWGTLEANGTIAVPLSFGDGGTGGSFAGRDDLSITLGLARSVQVAITPFGGSLALPDPLNANSIKVQDGDFSQISTSGVPIGTVLVLHYEVGSNIITNSASLRLEGAANYTTAAGDKSIFYLLDTTWYELLRIPNHVAGNATKFRRGDGTWQALAVQYNPAGIIQGLRLSNNVSDLDNDIDIAAGDAFSDDADPTLRVSMALAATMTKQLDATWAAGTNAGGRVSGQALADGPWHVFLFRRSGGAYDVCFSNSLTFTTPDSGTNRIRIGSIVRTANIRKFIQRGRRFYYEPISLDFDANATVAAADVTLPVPTGFAVVAMINIHKVSTFALLSPKDIADQAPSITVSPLANIGDGGDATAQAMEVLTDTAGKFRIRATGTQATKIVCTGWIDIELLTMMG